MPARKTFILRYRAVIALALLSLIGKILLDALRNQKQKKYSDKPGVREKGTLCEHCQKNIARVRIDYLIHSQRKSLYFCQSCAQNFTQTKEEMFKTLS